MSEKKNGGFSDAIFPSFRDAFSWPKRYTFSFTLLHKGRGRFATFPGGERPKIQKWALLLFFGCDRIISGGVAAHPHGANSSRSGNRKENQLPKTRKGKEGNERDCGRNSKKVAPIAEEYRLSRVYLFGSYAKGTAKQNSDVDVLIETRRPFGEYEEEQVRRAMTAALQAKVDLIHLDCFLLKEPRDASLLEKQRERYKDAVAKGRVLLYESA